MPESKKIKIKNLGEFLLKRDARIRRLSIRTAPDKGIWVNVPHSLSDVDAIEFIKQNAEWIQKARQKVKKRELERTLFTSNTHFQTKYHRLQINSSKGKYFQAKLDNGLLLIYCPESTPVESNEFQQFVQKAIVETLRREAKAYLPMRLSVLAKETGFHYKSIDIKNAKTRWGSCSHDNRINLNLHLMRLPDDLIDMVLLHELCHVKEKNHSQAFWKLLSGFCTNLEEKKKRLKNYSTTIF